MLTGRSDAVVQLTQAGQGGTQTSTPVTGTYAYTYVLTYPLLAQECVDCKSGMYWGDQNEGDYLDYYNARFMGFAQASVSKPDGSLETHKYYATEGWGVWDNSPGHVTCSTNLPPWNRQCHNSPWWDLGNAAHGREYEALYYGTDGTTLLKHARARYQAVCPPAGVGASQAGNWANQRVAELDQLSNPMAVCDVQTAQADTYANDGTTTDVAAPYSVVSYTYDGSGRVTQSVRGNGGGLKGEYYDNPDLTNLKDTRVDATVNFPWGTAAPDPAVAPFTYSVRWTGKVQPRYSETYTFSTFSDDGVRLWVNGQQLINNWTDHGPTQDSGTIALTAGQLYDIKMEYYQNGGGAWAALVWSSPSTPQDYIPATALFTQASASGSPQQVVTKTSYGAVGSFSTPAPDRLNTNQEGAWSATNLYLLDTPISSDTESAGGTQYDCGQAQYDAKGNPTQQTRNTNCNGGGTPLVTTLSYDAYGNLIGSNDPNGNTGCQGADNAQHTSCTNYNGNGDPNQSKQTGSDDALHSGTRNVGYTYTAAGGFGQWPTSVTDANGQTTYMSYDALGRQVSNFLPGEQATWTTGTSYTYWCMTGPQAPCYLEVDHSQRLDNAPNSGWFTTRAFYDGAGRLVETRKPAPNGRDVVQYTLYNAAGRASATSMPYFVTPAYAGGPGVAAYSIPDTSQVVSTATRDGLGRALSATDALSHVTQTAYVLSNWIDGTLCEQTYTVDPNGHITEAWRDGFGRLMYELRFTGNTWASYALYSTTRYTYDHAGRTTQITHPNGTSATTYAYDTAGRLTRMTDPDRGIEYYCYDKDGNQTLVEDARSSGTGTPCTPTSNAGTVYTGYDALGRPLWRNSVNSQTGAYATWGYDDVQNGNNGKGRLTSENFNGGQGSPNLGAGWYYSFYDGRGQKTNWWQNIGGTTYGFTLGYNDAGMPTSAVYPDGSANGETLAYVLDPASGWLASVQTTPSGGGAQALLTAIAYTGAGGAMGKATAATVAGGTYGYAAGYDLLGRLTSTSLGTLTPAATLFSSARTYDAAGNVASVATTLPSGTDNQAFCYDEFNRLTWAGNNGAAAPCGVAYTAGTLTAAQSSPATYTFDALDRLTSKPAGTLSYGDAAHLHAVMAMGTTYGASYDAAGDMTCRSGTSSTACGGSPTGAQLTYDAAGRLTHWQDTQACPCGATEDMAYDGEGQRVALAVNGGAPTYYLGALEEVSGGTVTKYLSTGGLAGLASVMRAGTSITLSYLIADGLGSVIGAVDGAGAATFQQLYAPYGGVRYTSGTAPTTRGFTGQRADSTSGLSYYGARYYDNAGSIFTAADSVRDGLNRYGYVGGNPETATDPSGHFRCLDDDCSDIGRQGPPAPPEPTPTTTGGDPVCKHQAHCGDSGGSDGSGGSGGYSAVTEADWGSCKQFDGHPLWCEKYGSYYRDPNNCVTAPATGEQSCLLWHLDLDKLYNLMDYAFLQLATSPFDLVWDVAATWYWLTPHHSLSDLSGADAAVSAGGGSFPSFGFGLADLIWVTVTVGYGVLLSKGGAPDPNLDVLPFLHNVSLSHGATWLFQGTNEVWNPNGYAIEHTISTNLVGISFFGGSFGVDCTFSIGGVPVSLCSL